MIYNISQIKLITKQIHNSQGPEFFVTKSFGILFLNLKIVPMMLQESQNNK